MTGLGELFDEAEGRAAASASGTRLEGESLGTVHAKVRRAHARRSAWQASLVAVAVVVLGAGVAWGVNRTSEPAPIATPSVTPSPSVPPSPSLSASPSPSETGFAWPGFVGSLTVDPHVPDAQVITRDVWASVEPGWVLISYREAWTTDDGEDRGPQILYLVSPTGDRYELVSVAGEDTVQVLAWETGSDTAVATVATPSGDKHLALVDLVTGATTPLEGYAPWLWSLAFLDEDGIPVWRGDDATSAYVAIAPDGSQAAYEIPAEEGAAELTEQETDAVSCEVYAPFDASYSLVGCARTEDGALQDIFKVSALHGFVEELYSGSGEATRGAPSRASRFVLSASGGTTGGECPTYYSALRDSGARTIPGSADYLHPFADSFQPYGTTQAVLVWGATSGCSGTTSPLVVISSRLDRNEYEVLVPFPADRPGGEDPYQSVTGVAVAN